MTPAPTRQASNALSWRMELRATATLAAPIVLTNLAQMAMGATDVLMMGQLGPDTLAAGALGVNLYLVFLIFGIGLMNAAAPLITRALGRNRDERDDVRRTAQQAYLSALCIAIPSWLVLYLAEPILIAMGQDPRLSVMAATYIHALQWSLLPFLCYLVLRAFVSALERPRIALIVGIAAVAVNALGNWCLMLGHCGIKPMGIAGSGLATTLTDILMFVTLFLFVERDAQFARYRLHVFVRMFDWARLRDFWRLGLPLAATLSFEVSIFNAAVFLMGLIGPAELAAHAIAIQIAALSYMVPLGIGQAATVRVGLAFGANDSGGITRAGGAALIAALANAVAISAVMLFAPHVLIGAFIDTTNPDTAEIVRLATTFLVIAALFQIADGLQGVGAGMLRGLHDGRVPMLFALLGYWGIGLPLGAVLAFPAHFGGAGIWFGLAAGLMVVAVLMISRWMLRERLGLVSAH